MGKQNPPPPDQASETTGAEFRVLEAELAKTRADPTTAVALAAELTVLMNGGCHLLVFSGQPMSVAVTVPGPAAIDVILAFRLSGVLQPLEQRQLEPDVLAVVCVVTNEGAR